MVKNRNNSTKPDKGAKIGNIRRKIDVALFHCLPLSANRNIGGRLRSVERLYEKSRKEQQRLYAGKDLPCPLCDDIANRKVVFATETMSIMENDYPYYMFDNLVVKRHLMLVPKRHISQFSDLNDAEWNEYWKILQKLSDQGYNSMTRAVGNNRRSVPAHLHTHMIQLYDKKT